MVVDSELFVCISASTTKSHCLLVSPEPPYHSSLIIGPGLNPLEYTYDDFFFNFMKNTSVLIEEFSGIIKMRGNKLPVTKLSLSMEGLHFNQDKEYIKNCVRELPISPDKEDDIVIVDRGVSCILAENMEISGSLIKAGTSAFSYCCFRNENGELNNRRIGGWGIFTGYDGGGYDIGRCSIYRIFDELEGRKENTGFLEKIKSVMRIGDLYELATIIKNAALNGTVRHDISELAFAIVKLAEEENDEVSMSILEQAGNRIYRNYKLLIHKLNTSQKQTVLGWPIIISGGLIGNSSIISSSVIKNLRQEFPNILIRLNKSKAILGNLLICCLEKGMDASSAFAIMEEIKKKEKGISIEYPSKVSGLF